MCGIIGFNWESKEEIKKSADLLSHRGPDHAGYFTDKNISLGHRRLAIIDLDKRSNQPMSYKGNYIIFNGEIFNFKEIKNQLLKKGLKFDTSSDTEVLLKAFIELKEKSLELLNGMYAFAVYDQNKNSIFIARDRLGIKPLYYYYKEKKFIFSSEIKAILALNVDKELDQHSINAYFTYNYFPEDMTPFKYIKKLKPGHYMELKDNKLSISKYWDVNTNETNLSLKENEEKLKSLLSDSVEKTLVSDAPLGVFLSGGLDSSAIVSLMHQNKVKDINTFTVSFGNYNENDVKNAKLVSEKFSTNHKEIFVDGDAIKVLPQVSYHLDEPLGDNACISTYLMSEETSKYAKVVLSGEGNDELFAGYDKYKVYKIRKYLPLRVPSIKSRVGNLVDPNFRKSYLEFNSVFNDKERKNLYQFYNKTDYNNNLLNRKFSLNNILLFDLKNWLPNRMLLKNDKMTMAHSLEGRVPFLDHRLVEFAFTIPAEQKIKFLKDKYVYRNMLKKLLPKQVYNMKKQGFTIPLENWIQSGIKDYSKDLISKNNISFLNKRIQFEVINNLEKNVFSKRRFWALLMFNQWYKEYSNHL